MKRCSFITKSVHISISGQVLLVIEQCGLKHNDVKCRRERSTRYSSMSKAIRANHPNGHGPINYGAYEPLLESADLPTAL